MLFRSNASRSMFWKRGSCAGMHQLSKREEAAIVRRRARVEKHHGQLARPVMLDCRRNRRWCVDEALLQLRRLAQFLGPVGLLPGKGHRRLRLAVGAGVADFLRLAAEVAVAGGALVD